MSQARKNAATHPPFDQVPPLENKGQPARGGDQPRGATDGALHSLHPREVLRVRRFPAPAPAPIQAVTGPRRGPYLVSLPPGATLPKLDFQAGTATRGQEQGPRARQAPRLPSRALSWQSRNEEGDPPGALPCPPAGASAHSCRGAASLHHSRSLCSQPASRLPRRRPPLPLQRRLALRWCFLAPSLLQFPPLPRSRFLFSSRRVIGWEWATPSRRRLAQGRSAPARAGGLCDAPPAAEPARQFPGAAPPSAARGASFLPKPAVDAHSCHSQEKFRFHGAGKGGDGRWRPLQAGLL